MDMPPLLPPTASTRARSALVLGMAFFIGTLVFFIVFQVVQIFGASTNEPLTPAEKRPAGSTGGVVLIPGTGETGVKSSPASMWSLADAPGRVVVVNFFATWCPPCVAETPDLVQVAKAYASKGVTVVGVSVDRDGDPRNSEPSREGTLRNFVRTHDVPYAILAPPANSLLWTFDFPIPQTFLYDRQGRRARAITGPTDYASLSQSLDELLKEPATQTGAP